MGGLKLVIACAAVILLTVVTSVGRGATVPVQPVPAPSDAKPLFEAQCAMCHGSDGRGGERGPDLIAPRSETSRSIDELAQIIRAGIPSSGMPPARVDEASIAALARYVRTLADNARTPRTFARVRLELRSGRVMQGLVQNEGDSDLQVLTEEGTLAALTRAEIAKVVELGRGPMPKLEPRDTVDAWGPGDWPTYNGDPGGNRHSPLRQITPDNVAQARIKWVYPVPGARNLRMTPIVVNGIMYVTAPNEVYALDARTGREIWQYRRPRTAGVIGDAGAGVHRGVAVLGDRLFVVTDDARLLALHRANGQLLWDVVMADYRQHYGATGAPLVVGDLVVSGISGGDEGARGFIAAFEAATGKEVWRVWTVPAPGEPGSETWRGKAIEHPCAATWLTGSYDATTNTLFWTTGNPCPDYNGAERIGDNLWSNSVLALDPATGKMRWYFQFTPHDLNDWDAVQTVVAADVAIDGQTRRLLLQANRNGFFYVLDRTNGKLLLAKPFVTEMNWATGIDPDGRPQRRPGMEPSVQGTKVCPSVVGATNWMSPAFNPDTGLYYVMALEECSIFTRSGVWFEPGKSFYGGGTRSVPGGKKYLRAIDIKTGKIAWEIPQVGEAHSWAGVLSTATGVVFFGDDSGGFAAADARTGRVLWRLPLNTTWRGSPMTYSVGADQFVAMAGGGNIFAFGLAAMTSDARVLESAFAPQEFELDPNPGAPEWEGAPGVLADHDMAGRPIAGPPTEIRSRWTREHLYLLYICPYDDLNLKPNPTLTEETAKLWNWDVAEAFIGSDFEQIARYKEFQVSPQGEWIDLDIDRADSTRQQGMAWNSGFAVKARIDERAKLWYAVMRIPFQAIDARAPEPGRELRLGLYRISGREPARTHHAWQPTHQATFHVPQAFGTLRLR